MNKHITSATLSSACLLSISAMKHIFIFFCIAISLNSCSKQSDITPIPVDVDSATTLVIDPERITTLETGDSSMLYDICSLELLNDQFIVHSRNYLKAYDRFSGNFTGDVAKEGKGDGKFSYIGNLWLNGDTICIFDTNLHARLYYSIDGKFHGKDYPFGEEFKTEEQPRQYMELPGIGIFSTNISTDHTTENNPRYSFYEFGQKQGRPVPGREITEPTFLADGTNIDSINNRLLSWEPLRDTIFAVTPTSVNPIYHVDFGDKAMPSEVQGMPLGIDRIRAFNKKSNPPYASLIRYVQPKDGKIYFSFAYGDEKNLIACFDENTGKTSVHHIAAADRSLSQTTFFKIIGDSAFVEICNRNDVFSNPYLYRIPLTDLQ